MRKEETFDYKDFDDEIEKIIYSMKGATIEEVTDTIVMSLGVKTYLKGYRYLRDAIVLSVIHPSVLDQITKGIYPFVAQKYHVDAVSVERNIRYAVTKMWGSAPDPERLHRLFSYTIGESGNPTNLEFISRVSGRIRRYYYKVNGF